MRNAETVLGIIRERGQRGLPLFDVYRQMFNRELFLLAYGRIYPNDGAMTPGVTEETVDTMSVAKIDQIIEQLRHERFRWKPTRRVYIEKKHSVKKRPLGMPTWTDKLVQEVIRLILDAFYEPQFSDHSHGFRPQRGCHTALSEIRNTWVGTKWFIEGDISQCFDSLDHNVLMQTLGERIHDNRFLRLLSGALKAGYLEDWKFNATHSGVPQGDVVSPILSNIYLHKLDSFVETTLLPVYNRGTERRRLKVYTQHYTNYKRALRNGEWEQARVYRKQMQSTPCRDPYDPEYRRLRYIRYADDFLLGFAGPYHEAEEIKRQIGEFLHDTLKLELSESKTLITHAITNTNMARGNRAEGAGAARFLGYEITILRNDHKHTKGKRSINGAVGLKVPTSVIKEKCSRYTRHGRPVHRMEMANDAVFSILTSYQLQYRGIANYYQLAYNLHRLSDLKWIMEVSLTKTLAMKLKISVEQVYRRYQTEVPTEHGMMKALQITIQNVERESKGKKPLVATWGGIPLRRKRREEQKQALLNDRDSVHPVGYARTEIVQRLLADTCELCGSQEDVEVHHIKAMKNLHKPGRSPRPKWVEVMAARHRKTLVVCLKCHNDIHAGRSLQRVRKTKDAQGKAQKVQETPTRTVSTGEPDTLKGVSPVRRGADGKVPV